MTRPWVLFSLLLPGLRGQFQPGLYEDWPCVGSYNISRYPAYLQVTAEDLVGNVINFTGIFSKSSSFNKYPVYRREYLYQDPHHSMTFPGQTRNQGVLRQSGLNFYMGNQGRWQLKEDGLATGYSSQDQACRDLTETSQDWRMSSVEGLSKHIRLRIERMEDVHYPDFYEISFAPLKLNGFYKQTQPSYSDAPIYKKPGLGSMQNYLFLYKGSWMVARDPLSQTMSYRMYQDSGASLVPLPSQPWHVVQNDGSLGSQAQIRVRGLQQTFPPSYTLASSGAVRENLPSLLGLYRLTNHTKYSIPVYENLEHHNFLFQDQDGSWVVSTSLSAGVKLLSQDSKGSPLPLDDVSWRYHLNGWQTDHTFRAIGEATPETRAAQLRLGLSIGFPVVAAVILVIIILALCSCLRKRKAKTLEDHSQTATLRRVSQL